MFYNRSNHVTSLNCTSTKEASDSFADYFASVAVDSSKYHLYEQFLYKYENYALSLANDTFLTDEDVRLAYDKLSFDKSGGADGVSGKHLLFCPDRIFKHILHLFKLYLQHGYVPESFAEGIIFPIILKDQLLDKNNIESYRPIIHYPLC